MKPQMMPEPSPVVQKEPEAVYIQRRALQEAVMLALNDFTGAGELRIEIPTSTRGVAEEVAVVQMTLGPPREKCKYCNGSGRESQKTGMPKFVIEG